MKNCEQLIKRPALAAVSLMCVSCNDSFLDRNPTHDLNDNSYWKTESDLEAVSYTHLDVYKRQ